MKPKKKFLKTLDGPNSRTEFTEEKVNLNIAQLH